MSKQKCPWTPAELAVVEACSHGRRLQEVADDLGIAVSTVKTHLRHAHSKVGVHGSRAGLVGLAFRNGWIR